ncbi:MAG: hypothetical protein H0X35_02355 [Pseudonocardiales bacterium]|nr:hypothetical protein [Pseudonocardiales bacterium]
MVTPADVRRWDPVRLEEAFRTIGMARDTLLRLDAALSAARPDDADWQGTAAELGRAAHDRIADRLRALGEDTGALRPGLGGAIDAVVAMRADLAMLDGVARQAASSSATTARSPTGCTASWASLRESGSPSRR